MSNEIQRVDAETGEITAVAPANLFGATDPAAVIEKAGVVAKALADVILAQELFTVIGDKRHVRVEGWTLCGSMLGVFPVCVWTRPVDGGWEARVEARTINGAVVGAAEASCSRDESTWAKRPDYAIRSMAQTRATSKALRQPLGFIIQLAGYATTPAEEMDSTMRRQPDKGAEELNRAVKPNGRGGLATSLLKELETVESGGIAAWEKKWAGAVKKLDGQDLFDVRARIDEIKTDLPF